MAPMISHVRMAGIEAFAPWAMRVNASARKTADSTVRMPRALSMLRYTGAGSFDRDIKNDVAIGNVLFGAVVARIVHVLLALGHAPVRLSNHVWDVADVVPDQIRGELVSL